jgi:predicted O-linked N-acetylglucosamine transferase (SPINDLY family)
LLRANRPAISPHASVLLLDDPQDQLLCARTWAANQVPSRPGLARGAYNHDRLRVAYVSADFHQHATAMLLAGVLEEHDRERFEIIGVSFGPDDSSALRKRVIAACDRFVDLGSASDQEIAQRLLEFETDIAVDLKGYTQGSRPGIFACRPAPIQINYLGHPGTMGAEYIDYILADEIVIPREQQRYFAEQVVYLPGCYQANDSKRPIAQTTLNRADAGLPENAFVFCCFNNSCKITREIFGAWMRLLSDIESSVLWLLAGNDTAVHNLRIAAEAAGISPQRLVFAPRASPGEHLARHRLADLFVDTLPCSAHTAASDALWAGLPLITVAGTTFAGRVAASLLTALGLPQLITHSLADYEAVALSLAREPEKLATIRRTVGERRNTSTLFDTQRITRSLERAYLMMWERCRQNLLPQGFAVPAT